ncbi:MAG TPA: class F sortase [Gaiellaceae bacterium]
MRSGSLLAATSCALAFLAAPSGSHAAVPPNRNDPCSSGGRDTCGTLGVGFYKGSRYGTRWFGDFRNAVPGHAHTFCIDLRFWYASRSYRYHPAASAVLRNRDGEAVPAANQAKLAYAIARFGRTSQPARQAAVMLYVHSQMGDARPGELDAAALGPAIATQFRTIARAAKLYHGPYRLEAHLADKLTVGRPATASIRLLSAAGQPLPHVQLTLAARGADGPARVQTNDEGLAEVALTPTAVDLHLSVVTARLASTRPSIFVPTSTVAAANGQRLAAPGFAHVSAAVTRQARPIVTTTVSQAIVRPGSQIFDRIRVQGLGTATAEVEVLLYGPFASQAKLSCAGRPYWTGRVMVRGETEVRSQPVKVGRVGFYAYRERIAGSPAIPEVTTDCALTRETTLVAPRIVAGRGDVADSTAAPAPRSRPVTVRIPSLGISAAVRPVGIDITHGVLGLQPAIRRTGWWHDGMAPGASSGAVLIAGHVDSKRAGAGAFFKLHGAVRGSRVQVATADGGVFAYRVVSVRSYRKSALPTSIYSRTGAPRLVLVTCGGPFDPADGHYRDNIVVTAVPVPS